MLKNNVSRTLTMNVFGGSQSGETKKIISELEQSFKNNLVKLETFGRLLHENIENAKIHEEKIKALQLLCAENKESIDKNFQATLNSLEQLKKISPL